jgi:hypothetical protein
MMIIGSLSQFSSIAAALLIRFDMNNKKKNLNIIIQNLNKIKDNLDYIISCNGGLTEDECEKILNEVRQI